MKRIKKDLYNLSNSIITPIVKDNETICTVDSIKIIFKRWYPTFTFSVYQNENEEIDIDTEFSRTWDLFLSINQKNIDRIFETYSQNYDPLANYDRESIVTKTIDGTMSDTNIKTGSIANSNGSQTNVITNEVSPDSTNNFYNTDKATNQIGARSDSMTYNNVTDTMTHAFDEYEERTVDNTHGNIGVQKSQEMLMSEIEVRNLTYLELFVERFVKRFCVPPVVEVGE